MPSSGIIENRPQFLVPQFMTRPILDSGNVSPCALMNFYNTGWLSDVLVDYITVYHNDGAPRNLQIYVYVDGQAYNTGIVAVADVTRTYIFHDPNETVGNGLDVTVNRTLAGGDVPWYGQNFNVQFVSRAAGTDNARAWVRYKQL